MNQKSIITSAFLILITALSFYYYQPINQSLIHFSREVKSNFLYQKEAIKQYFRTHFNQKETILLLEKQIKELEPQASLSVAFATKLNHLLDEANLSVYDPRLHLVQTLGYESMQEKSRLWIEFPAFEKEKSYGLIFGGYTAGIIREKSGQPLAILQSHKESIFSVFIGEHKIQGVAFGNGKNLIIKFIPNYETPQVGDVVVTSGNDKIFYEGIRVGTIENVEKKDMYKIATVKPYLTFKEANFYYAVEVK